MATSEYIYVNLKTNSKEPISSYLYHLSRPLIISGACSATLLQAYVLCKRAGTKTNPILLRIVGAGANAIRDKDNMPEHAAACLIPLRNVIHSNINMLPLASGIYNCFTISLHDITGEAVTFDHLILTIKIDKF